MADLTITPSNVVPPSPSTTTHDSARLLAGEVINAGETYCIATADGKAYKADANNADRMPVSGIAGNSAVAAGQRLDGITASPALAVGAHGADIATAFYQSNTPGKLCAYEDLTAGSRVQLVAIAATSTTLQVVANAGGVIAIP